MDLGKKLGAEIRRIREAKGYTQAQFAEQCGVRRPQISKVEKDASASSGELLIKISKVLGVELSFVEPSMRELATRLLQGGLSGCFKDQEEAKPYIQQDMQAATDIRLLLFRGWGILGRQDSLIRSILEGKGSDARIRILFLSPQSHHAQDWEERIGEVPESISNGIRETIKRVEMIRQQTKAHLEYGLYDIFPVWQLFFADDKVFVSSYLRQQKLIAVHNIHYKAEKKERPSESLFLSFDNYFEDLWEHKLPPEYSTLGMAD